MAKYFTFTKENVFLKKYKNNRSAIEISSPIDGPICIATINIPEYPLNNNEVIIKNYSENEGVLDDLINLKIISEPISTIKYNLITAYVCELLV